MREVRSIDRKVDERLYVKSLAKALDVLECFGPNQRQMTVSDISQATGVHISAVNRVVQTLLYRNYLSEGEQKGFMLGSKLLDLTFDYLRTHPYVIRATPIMAELRRNLGLRVDFSLFEYTTIVYVARMQSNRETLNASLIGRRLQSFATTGGRACMALLPDEIVEDILERSPRPKLTPFTITDVPTLIEKVREARRDGFAIATSEYLQGEIVVAAPIRGANGLPVGALHIAGLQSELSPEHVRAQIVPLLLEAARAVELN